MMRLSAGLMSVLVFLFCLFISSHGNAQNILDQFKKTMPALQLMSVADFSAATREVSEKPGGDADLEYTMRIPRDWSRGENTNLDGFTVADKVLGEVAKFYSPAPAGASSSGGAVNPSVSYAQTEDAPLLDRSYILMRAGGLGYTMTAHEWFIQYLLANKFSLQGMVEHGEDSAEALYVVLSDSNTSYAVRGLARINGGKIIFTEYYVPLEKWQEEKVMQAQVLQSLVMKNKRVGGVEPLNSYKFLDIEEIHYPSSWTLQTSPIRSVDRMKIKLFNLGLTMDGDKEVKKLDGRIDVEMVSVHATENVDKELEEYRDGVAEQGLVLGKIIDRPEDFILNPVFDFAETTVYESGDAANKFIGYEFWVTLVSMDGYYFFVSLLTPSRDANYFLWAKNRQHYKLLINSIKSR